MTPHESQAALLRKYGLRLNKRLGQHFLVDQRVLARIVDSILDLGVRRVVELGAGAGALSAALLRAGLQVEALELDERMLELLKTEYASEGLKVRRADIAREDLAATVGAEPMCFAGNLPYQVTSPVLFALNEALTRSACRGAILMMQAEVATRLCARPGGRDYGVLTVLLGARCNARRIFRVRPGSFLPPPKVHSAVVELRPRDQVVELGERGCTLVKELFRERRKQIGGLLKRRQSWDDAQLRRMRESTGIDPRLRPEDLSISDFRALDLYLEESRTES
jgi:16S rRNA (adenine1518-N6/adenine1519-N6)-dimethyltransferase